MRTFLTAFVLLVCLNVSATQAAVVVQMREMAGDVVFSYAGSLDLSGVGNPGLSFSFGGITPSGGDLSFASPSGTETEIYSTAIATSSVFGSGGRTPGSVFQGDPFSVSSSAITMPRNYISGSPIVGSFSFQGQSFSSLGINSLAAPYVWTVNGSGDSITLTAVPEPSSLAACVLFPVWYAVRRKRR
ncbi:hypothetical protein [Rubripirellula reticaptiva]|uniref:PEP-CTERM protein-sorting domain-containing protein n=1 Tax=Rubripirellula reticaptiva TaxID=2528013 RepID=A0A5C6ES83_9BACT|nr:hypothetical protein [Rubripirellula reticaptiva]TWU51858.1 hypothetical protein Poly59_34530 [Rubripirellula reticaptiva]